MVNSNSDTKKSFLRLLTIFVSFLYISGYLISSTHLSRFGIKDIGAFIKIKYIYIGIIYLCFCFPIIPILAIFHVLPIIRLTGYQETKSSGTIKTVYKFNNRKIYLETIVIILLLISLFCAIFVYLLFFANHGRMQHNPYVIASNFFIIFLLAISEVTIRNIKHWLLLKKESHIYLRWIILSLFVSYLILIYLDMKYFSDIFQKIYLSLNNYGFNFILTLILIGIFLERGFRYHDLLPNRRSKFIIYAISPFLFILYFLNILTFALYIYPYIPVERGGANYNTAPIAKIKAKNDKISDETIKMITGGEVRIIEDYDTFVYLSIGSWEKYLQDIKLSSAPAIIKLNTEDIETIEIKPVFRTKIEKIQPQP